MRVILSVSSFASYFALYLKLNDVIL